MIESNAANTKVCNIACYSGSLILDPNKKKYLKQYILKLKTRIISNFTRNEKSAIARCKIDSSLTLIIAQHVDQ